MASTKTTAEEISVPSFPGIQIPKGLEMQNLKPDFEPIKGFLRRPTEDDPTPVTFAGILIDAIKYKNPKKPKEDAYWYSFVATQDFPNCILDDKDEGELPVEKGDRVGVSESGAIKVLSIKDDNGRLAKRGHFVQLHWTGKKVETKNGDMWEIVSAVSTHPFKGFDPSSGEVHL